MGGQVGFFSEWAEGMNAEQLSAEQRAAWAQHLPIEWVSALPASLMPRPGSCLPHRLFAPARFLPVAMWVSRVPNAMHSSAAPLMLRSSKFLHTVVNYHRSMHLLYVMKPQCKCVREQRGSVAS